MKYLHYVTEVENYIIDIKNIEKSKKLFEYCMNKSDCYWINNVCNFRDMNKEYLSNNAQKSYRLWYYDYNNFKEDDISTLEEVYRYLVNAVDILYLKVPKGNNFEEIISELKNCKNMNIEFSEENGKSYYKIFGVMNSRIKNVFLNIDMIKIIKEENNDTIFQLRDSFLKQRGINIINNSVGFIFTDDDITLIQKNTDISRKKMLSNEGLYGEVNNETKSMLFQLFETSIDISERNMKPHFNEMCFYASKRQMFFYTSDEIFLCLTNEEYHELISQYDIISPNELRLLKKSNEYNIPYDYFSLSLD